MPEYRVSESLASFQYRLDSYTREAPFTAAEIKAQVLGGGNLNYNVGRRNANNQANPQPGVFSSVQPALVFQNAQAEELLAEAKEFLSPPASPSEIEKRIRKEGLSETVEELVNKKGEATVDEEVSKAVSEDVVVQKKESKDPAKVEDSKPQPANHSDEKPTDDNDIPIPSGTALIANHIKLNLHTPVDDDFVESIIKQSDARIKDSPRVMKANAGIINANMENTVEITEELVAAKDVERDLLETDYGLKDLGEKMRAGKSPGEDGNF